MKVVVHAGDPTTAPLKMLYEQDADAILVDERSTNSGVVAALRSATEVVMLGHGDADGLFSVPKVAGDFRRVRLLVSGRHVQYLRGKTCVGIWCYASDFAEKYGLTGLFSGMIISEYREAEAKGIETTPREVETEFVKFVERLHHCLLTGPLSEVPARMLALDDRQSPLTQFNYANLFYFPEKE